MAKEKQSQKFRRLLNIIWMPLGGVILALELSIAGILIGIFSRKTAKMLFGTSKDVLFPFYRDIKYDFKNHKVGNILFFPFGLVLYVQCCIIGGVFCLSIIGLPLANQWFKVGQMYLLPFGARLVEEVNLSLPKENAKKEIEDYALQLAINHRRLKAKSELDNYIR